MKKSRKKTNKLSSQFSSPFFKTSGIIIAIILGIVLIFALLFGIGYAHDWIVGSKYENLPAYSKDNAWGGLQVNVVIDKKAIREPGQDFVVDCSGAGQKSIDEFAKKFGLPTKPCVPGQKIAGSPGAVVVEGEINVKNQLWRDSIIIPANLLTFNHDGRQVKPELTSKIFGRYINPGEGVSTKFRYEEPYTAKDFQLYLNNLTHHSLIVNDTVEAERI